MNTHPTPLARLGVVVAVVAMSLLAALALAVPAVAAVKGKAGIGPKPWNVPNKAVTYEGKTASGHKVSFTFKKNRLYDMESGIGVSCVSIQGGGSPTGGVETFSYEGYVGLSRQPVEFVFLKKPAIHYNEVTTTHQLSSKINRKNGTITGTQRIQYSFLIPKYPIGTFVIYSCLGEGSFTAKPVIKK